jgi:hypothetical protein
MTAPSPADPPTRSAPAASTSLSHKETLEVVSKLGAIGVLACYVLGFAVFHAHLRQYGVFTLSPFRAHYLLAGLWALLPVLLGWSLLDYLWVQNPTFLDRAGPTKVAIGMVLAIAISIAVTTHPNWLQHASMIGRVLALTFAGLIFSGAVIVFARAVPAFVLTEQPLKPGLLVFLGFALYLGWAYTASVASILYAHTPFTLGGGKPTWVRVAITCDARSSLATLGLALDSTCASDVRLLLATDDDVTLLPDSTGYHAVTVTRALVKAISFAPDSAD